MDVPRDELPQGAENDMDVLINAQSLINVSKKRLCGKASPETRHAWIEVTNKMAEIDPAMARLMVPECVYRGFCPYGKDGCGYVNSNNFKEVRQDYIDIVKEFDE